MIRTTDHFSSTLHTDQEIVTRQLERWADEIGDNIYFYYGENDKSYSYKKFNEMTNSIAHYLTSSGIKKGDRISVFLKNPFVTTLAMFGIWKAGAIYCPINFNYKGKLLTYQLNDTEPELLITEKRMLPIINEINQKVTIPSLIVHSPKKQDHDYNSEVSDYLFEYPAKEIPFDDLLEGNTENVMIPVHYSDTANIIYTSGTTGPAKGVVQSYRWMNAYTHTFRLFNNQHDIVYNDLPLYHVGGAFALVARAAFVGCKVAVWDKFSPNDFWKRIHLSGASNAILLDVMIPWLMKAHEKPDDYKNPLNKVYMQPLPDYHHKVAKRFGFDFVFAGYGQTESGNGFVSIIEELGEGKGTPHNLYKGYTHKQIKEIANDVKITIRQGSTKLRKGHMGASSPFIQAAILNENDKECAAGEVGELAFRAKYPSLILNEYFNKPDATKKAFQNGWFHTGDAAYKDDESDYYFVDRLGDVIRHRGENISSYQIEDAINSHKSVQVSAVFPIPALEGDEDDIAAYIVLKADEIETTESIIEFLNREIPKFMLPNYVRFIEDLPRTPTNKIEKFKLKKLLSEELSCDS